MKAYLKDLSDVIDPETNLTCGGGYGTGDAVYIDERLPKEKQRLTLVHEVLEIHFPRVKHSRIDKAAIDLIDCLLQLNMIT
ncbi:hypothetical protein LCGC14_0861530 [marine sediment metagenome]|uniref:Uncharacterized protein n=1 Tax=marine sediment metagenome TaxID=412755 RepID=A0A0F9PC81_9ZZZZ